MYSTSTVCAVMAVAVSAKPANVSHREAASLPLAALTALQGLVTQGGLVKGQRVAILGGSGGVGSLAIQIAKVVCWALVNMLSM